jgi:predicted AAA+ superfamily ATPase
LDEVQKLPQFQNQIKVLYDLYPNIKFVISGSTSLFIRKKTQESLAGRIISCFVNPLSFYEYLFFKEKEEILEKPLVYQKELRQEFDLFLTCQLRLSKR